MTRLRDKLDCFQGSNGNFLRKHDATLGIVYKSNREGIPCMACGEIKKRVVVKVRNGVKATICTDCMWEEE